MSIVTLQPVDEDVLRRLLDVAVADADPEEVMPPVPGPSGWTAERRAAFLDHHTSARGTTYAVLAEGRLAGAARLAPAEAPGAAEACVWLGRSTRGKGFGIEVLHLLIEEARTNGLTALVAETNAANRPAVGTLRALGAKLWEDPESGAVHATLRVGDSASG
jgi:RimJ/RimL family protein N-acetyltransferase